MTPGALHRIMRKSFKNREYRMILAVQTTVARLPHVPG